MRLDRIVHSNDPRLAAVIEIYVEAIPASERKPKRWLGEAAERDDFRLTVATIEDEIVGFALTFSPSNDEFALLEYLAVIRQQRGQGLGGQIFDAVIEQTGGRALIAEVETADARDGESPQHRRQLFYTRRGCQRVIDLQYQLPLVNTAPPPMQLLIAAAPAKLGKQRLKRWLTHIYTDVYGTRADDLRLDEMLSNVSDPVVLD